MGNAVYCISRKAFSVVFSLFWYPVIEYIHFYVFLVLQETDTEPKGILEELGIAS